MTTKSLFLLRHAKAIAGGILVPDIDRTLSDRGVKDAKKLGSKLLKKSLDFDLILTSPSIRTITTAQLVANKLGYKQKYIAVEKRLNGADVQNILSLISKVSKKVDKLMIVGHNPSISTLACHLAGEPIAMPTCALIELIFDIKDWDQVGAIKADKIHLLN